MTLNNYTQKSQQSILTCPQLVQDYQHQADGFLTKG
jgi:hypothetical protein